MRASSSLIYFGTQAAPSGERRRGRGLCGRCRSALRGSSNWPAKLTIALFKGQLAAGIPGTRKGRLWSRLPV